MKSYLTTKWLELLKELSTKNFISFKTQSVYSSNTFYVVMAEFEHLGWVKRINDHGNGCVEKLNFEISIEGEFIVLALSDMLNKE